MVALARTRKTVEDYMALPDDVRVELIGGEFYVSPSPGRSHQRVLLRLLLAIGPHVETRRIGEIFCAPFDTFLSDEDVVQPDILFVKQANRHRIEERLQGPPDVAVEILSRTHTERDRIVKRDLYRTFGVPEYWIVDPDARTIEVLCLEAGDWRLHGIYDAADTLSTPAFPDLALDVAAIFTAR